MIFFTLVVQGLTLPALIRRLGVARRRRRGARGAAARDRGRRAALDRLDELAEEEWTRDDTVERMRAAVRVPQAALRPAPGEIEDDGDRGPLARLPAHDARAARRPARRARRGCATRARSRTR